jgi:ribosomal protein S18 acetylase RimI-like enzyme
LLPQLSQSAEIPTAKYVEELFYDKNTHLIVAEEDELIVGMLTLVVVNIPTGRKAWIEDVVIDGDYRGRNIGFLLVEESKKLATSLGVKKIYLT